MKGKAVLSVMLALLALVGAACGVGGPMGQSGAPSGSIAPSAPLQSEPVPIAQTFALLTPGDFLCLSAQPNVEDGMLVYRYAADDAAWQAYGLALQALAPRDGVQVTETTGGYICEKDGVQVEIARPDGAEILLRHSADTAVVPGGLALTYAFLRENGIEPTAESLQALESMVNLRGNTPANLHNGGSVAWQDGWLYFCDYTYEGAIYRVRVGETQTETLVQGVYPYGLNVVGDMLVFCLDDPQGYGIYRADIFGGAPERLVENGVLGYVLGDTLFYSDNATDALYALPLSGGEPAEALRPKGYMHNVGPAGMLAVDAAGVDGIAWFPRSGGAGEQIADVDAFSLITYGDVLVYATSRIDGSRAFSMDIQGASEPAEVAQGVTQPVTDGNWLYYIQQDTQALMAVSLAGGEPKTLAQNARNPALLGCGERTYLFYETDTRLMIFNPRTETAKPFLPQDGILDGAVWE